MLFSFVLKYFLSPLRFLHWLIVGLSVLRDFHTCVNSPDSLRVWTFHFIPLWSGRYCRISTFLTLFRPDSWPRSGAAMPHTGQVQGHDARKGWLSLHDRHIDPLGQCNIPNQCAHTPRLQICKAKVEKIKSWNTQIHRVRKSLTRDSQGC